MAVASQVAIAKLAALIDQVDQPLKTTFQSEVEGNDPGLVCRYHNVHQGYPTATLVRFLKAREWSVPKAHQMLVDCLNWRIQNQIDENLKKPITPTDLYRGIRESQLVGLTGYTKEGLPVFVLGVGRSTFDKAPVNYYVQSHIQINEYRDRVILPAATKKHGQYIGTCVKILDMTGLRLSALSHIKLLTILSTIDDLNYPEKTQTYYVVNAPYVFSACWKVVKPLLHERTRRKIQVLQGCGRDELLKIMDYDSLPYFCRRQSSSSSRVSSGGADDCYSLDHPFHQELYNYIKQQAANRRNASLLKQGSLRIDVLGADREGIKIVKTTKTQSELRKISDFSRLARSLSGPYIDIA